MQQKHLMQILYDGLPKILGELFLHLPTFMFGTNDVNDSYGNLALLFEMEQCVF
jgi:hypothetical protein